MTNNEFAQALVPEGTAMGDFPSAKAVAYIIRDFYTPEELLEFKKVFDEVVDTRMRASFSANKVAWERAAWINQYLKGDMFLEDIDAEVNKPCQIDNSQVIVDRTAQVLGIK